MFGLLVRVGLYIVKGPNIRTVDDIVYNIDMQPFKTYNGSACLYGFSTPP